MNSIYLQNNQSDFKARSGILLLKEAKPTDFRSKNMPFVSNISEKALVNLIGKAKTLRYSKKGNH
jgi:hypothetical protein